MGTANQQLGATLEPRHRGASVHPIQRRPLDADAGEFPVTKVAAAFRGFLESLGLDIDDPNLAGTADRVARAYQEMLGGLRRAEPRLSTFPNTKGYNLHAPSEIGIDSFQADRSPTRMYRTAPPAGLWSHQKRGFYHDGRFANLREIIDHYDEFRGLKLTDQEKRDLAEYLKSL